MHLVVASVLICAKISETAFTLSVAIFSYYISVHVHMMKGHLGNVVVWLSP